MKKLIIVTAVIISIPFFVVEFFKVPEKKLKEIELKYLSNIMVRVKRSSGNVESVPLEEYVVGVVAGEMPVSFELEALKAQSVASRTYVMKRLGGNGEYDVVDIGFYMLFDFDKINSTVLNHMPLKWKDNYVSYINKVRQAVNETSMECLEYDGELIDAMFFSTSNGYTEDSGEFFSTSLPYLKSVDSSYDKEVSSVFQDSKNISLQEFYERLGLSYQSSLKITDVSRTNSHRVKSLKINGKEFSGKDVYYKLGLRSSDFEIELVGSNVVIQTKGYGHGVGMSQYGALGMAKKGYSYREILMHYYTGTTLVKK